MGSDSKNMGPPRPGFVVFAVVRGYRVISMHSHWDTGDRLVGGMLLNFFPCSFFFGTAY